MTIAANVNILAHDASTKIHLGYAKIQNVLIEDNVFIGANSTILSGVKIGKNSIVADGSVVIKSVPSNMVLGGNPARVICELSKYLDKHQKNILNSPDAVFNEKYTLRFNV